RSAHADLRAGGRKTRTRQSAGTSSFFEVLLDLHDRLHAICRFLLPILLVEIKVEGAVANAARIRRVEIISEIGPDERPFANHIFVMRVEVDTLGPDGLSKLDLAATDRVDIDDNRIEERRTRRHEPIGLAHVRSVIEARHEIGYEGKPADDRRGKTLQRGVTDGARNLVGVMVKRWRQIGRWVAIVEIVAPAGLAAIGMNHGA